MFDVAKLIRILGYIVYVILMSPMILITLIIAPTWLYYEMSQMGATKEEYKHTLKKLFKMSIEHDMNFIKTGVW